jgi:hypothetical protein
MISERKAIWTEIENKLIKFFLMTRDQFFANLNSLSLYDFMHLSNLLIEIGLEYSGEKTSTLLSFIKSDLTQFYLEELRTKMLTKFRHICEKETWEPIYLPVGFKINGMSLADYPEPDIMKKEISLFY